MKIINKEEHVVSFPEALRVWIKVALNSFGGPAGQIAVIHKIVVEEKKWISETRFLHALNYCMLLPGPEAQQLATYIGWLLHKTKGGLVAGILFIVPGFLSILVLSLIYVLFQDVTLVQGIFYGIKPAVLAIVMGAVIKIGSRALKNEVMVGLAVLAFIAIFFFNIAFPLIVLSAGIIGFVGGKVYQDKFFVIKGHPDKGDESEGIAEKYMHHIRPSFIGSLKTALFWLALWAVPVVGLLWYFGRNHIFTQESIFFSKAAIVTFGGAYSVLAYIAQKAVEDFGWLMPGEMLDGLGMAETTPGPLIQVVQFVGFMGAWRASGSMDPILAAVLASFIVTWVTFVPCFLFIFTGAPYIEHLRGNKNLSTALSGITAAVVGVILNLGIWFSLNTIFDEVREEFYGPIRLYMPSLASIDWGSLFLAAVALFTYFKLKLDMLKVLGVNIILGVIWWVVK